LFFSSLSIGRSLIGFSSAALTRLFICSNCL
jgi:hypothetical protein